MLLYRLSSERCDIYSSNPVRIVKFFTMLSTAPSPAHLSPRYQTYLQVSSVTAFWVRLDVVPSGGDAFSLQIWKVPGLRNRLCEPGRFDSAALGSRQQHGED